jgi:hypothetical protein
MLHMGCDTRTGGGRGGGLHTMHGSWVCCVMKYTRITSCSTHGDYVSRVLVVFVRGVVKVLGTLSSGMVCFAVWGVLLSACCQWGWKVLGGAASVVVPKCWRCWRWYIMMCWWCLLSVSRV